MRRSKPDPTRWLPFHGPFPDNATNRYTRHVQGCQPCQRGVYGDPPCEEGKRLRAEMERERGT